MGTRHGIDAGTRVTATDADRVARVMGLLAAPSRVRILSELRDGDRAVGDLAETLDMTQPAVSQQLRLLRDASLVMGTRVGREVVYSLHDPHVATLLDETMRHVAHLSPAHPTGAPDRIARPDSQTG